ncbi:MAG: Smr/MutS family protein [Gammaproteobacteria bacterium]|nr:Smr/MutS family protein [Gammaproteobacteria bacterium]
MQRDLNPEDRAAFTEAMRDVRPRGESPRQSQRPPPPAPRPRLREADDAAVIEELHRGPLDADPAEAVDALTFRAAGLQDAAWRRLRRGSYRIGAELDLHGLNRQRAQRAVALFLTDCQLHGVRCVRIVHGKGLGSPNSGPVIKTLLDGWLRRRRDVLAFCSARPHDGGTGAAYVLLRATDRGQRR